jgi:peptidoglycan/LPS O-acetylase OafA/YrhL
MMNKIYRTDIDGLRAIAVVSVILFHLGFLKNGYLGVDIFFVISGYLITGIVYGEVSSGSFSVLKFYERRIRRILPLVLFASFLAYLVGLIYMLPDDLENLCQSVVASNFSANNILMYLTSNDYWAVKNDFKPLMHTWSLGIEEQFYLIYPFIFFLFKDKRQYILGLLILLTIISLFIFFRSNDTSQKFYFIQFRFFELSIGGIFSILSTKFNFSSYVFSSKILLYFALLCLTLMLILNPIQNNDFKIIITTLLTSIVLLFGGLHFDSDRNYKWIISNKIMVSIGKISFSLYIWHQIIFAFARYVLFEDINSINSFPLVCLIFILSIASYQLIESPFRNRQFLSTKFVLVTVFSIWILLTALSFYTYAIGGIIKDVPQLGIIKANHNAQFNFFDSDNNIHIQYNELVRKEDRPFTNIVSLKILVIGDSYGRDFVNILHESKFSKKIDVSYLDPNKKLNEEILYRIEKADYVFYTSNQGINELSFKKLINIYKVEANKLWLVGIKDFGNSNGIHYNNPKNETVNCSSYRTSMKKGVFDFNKSLKLTWGKRYIDLIGLISDKDGKVLVFTNECKFISQDTMHLTKFGAHFFAELLESKLRTILIGI